MVGLTEFTDHILHFLLTFGLILLGRAIMERRRGTKQKHPTTIPHPTIPGLKQRDDVSGNLVDIGHAGSFHQFLSDLHHQYGDIASFWFGPTYSVSICSPDLFTQHGNVFDRPALFFKLFVPFIGEKSLQYANGEDAREKRKEYDRPMSHRAVSQYIPDFISASEEICADIECDITNTTPTRSTTLMHHFAMKSSLWTLFGRSSVDPTQFIDYYNECWGEMESRLAGDMPEPGSDKEQNFTNALNGAKEFVREVVKARNEDGDTEEERFIDILVRNCGDDEELLIADAITYVVGSSHTTANSLAWAVYYLATYPEIQTRAREEVDRILKEEGGGGVVTKETIPKLRYLRQVIDETLRCAVLAPFAARVSDETTEIGGFSIPAGTPVVHALGVAQQDPKYFPDHTTFKPERFSTDAIKSRPKMAFKPFGFAGKRVCPGYRFAYVEASVCLVELLRRFRWVLVDGHGEVERVYGLVTHPSIEVMVNFTKRE